MHYIGGLPPDNRATHLKLTFNLISEMRLVSHIIRMQHVMHVKYTLGSS